MENNVNKSNKLTSILLIIIAALLGLVAYLVYDKIQTSPKATTEPKQEIKVEPKILTGEETDASSDIKAQILAKTNALLYLKNDTASKSINDVGHIKELLENLTLDSDNKLRIALYNSKKSNLHSTKNEVSRKEVIAMINDYISFYSMDQYFSGNYMGEYDQIDGDEVARNYKELFNEEVSHKDLSNWCPFSYYYDSKSNQYYANNQCGGTAFDEILYYFDKATIKENEAYAYIYIGYMDNGTHENKDTNVYTDIDKKNKVETIAAEKAQDYAITASNKDSFTKYKITFKLDKSNNYYFDKIEK